LILFTDELHRSPELLLRRIYEFLGIAPDFVPANIGTRYRVGGERRYKWLKIGEARRAIAHNQIAHSTWRSLPDAIRHPIDRAFDRSVYAVDLWNRRKSTDNDELSSVTQRVLREHFDVDAQLLTSLLDVPIPWQSLPVD
jgi:hypothetical protein